MRRRRPARDQASSPFSVLLEDLLAAVPFIRAAAIYDAEGETVDYAGDLDPFEIKVAAATYQLVAIELRECEILRSTSEIRISTSKGGVILRSYGEGYGLICFVRTLGTHAASARALDEIGARIVQEAGLPVLRQPLWFRVEVEINSIDRKPRKLRRAPRFEAPLDVAPWISFEILGTVVGLHDSERGYRVRLSTGAEVTLVQESRRLWFVDQQLELRDPKRLRGGSLADVFEMSQTSPRR